MATLPGAERSATNLLIFNVSGTAMGVLDGSELSSRPEAYDGGTPGSRDACASLKTATPVRRGRGRSYVVTTTPAGAETIRDYCATVGPGFAAEVDAETRADGRALLAVADRIAKLQADRELEAEIAAGRACGDHERPLPCLECA